MILNTPEKVLLQAALLIEQYGHTKGVNKDPHGCLCIYGAVEGTKAPVAVQNRALAALRERLMNMPDGSWTISGWNDLPDTTPKQVVDLLREVARKVRHDE